MYTREQLEQWKKESLIQLVLKYQRHIAQPYLTEDQRAMILKLKKQKKTHRVIAARVGCSTETVSRIWRESQQEESKRVKRRIKKEKGGKGS